MAKSLLMQLLGLKVSGSNPSPQLLSFVNAAADVNVSAATISTSFMLLLIAVIVPDDITVVSIDSETSGVNVVSSGCCCYSNRFYTCLCLAERFMM